MRLTTSGPKDVAKIILCFAPLKKRRLYFERFCDIELFIWGLDDVGLFMIVFLVKSK